MTSALQESARAFRDGGFSPSPFRARHLVFAALLLLSVIPFWATIASLVELSLRDARYSHTALVPLMSAGIVWLESRRIFRTARPSRRLALALLLAGLLLHAGMVWWVTSPAHALAGQVLSLLLVWVGSFALCYGADSLKAAAFPLGLLVLAIPIPVKAVETLSFALQAGSAELSHALFRVLGVPVFRQDYLFSLPGLTIEVAEECSGIRSSTALMISSVLTGYLFLRSGWKRLALVLVTAFAGLLKNAIRIVFLATMGAYIDEDFLHGALHHRYGGTVFSLLAVLLIAPAFVALRRSERSKIPSPERGRER